MPSDVAIDPVALQQRQQEMAAGIPADAVAAETAEAGASVAARLDMHEGAIGRLHARLARIEEVAQLYWRSHFTDRAADHPAPAAPPPTI